MRFGAFLTPALFALAACSVGAGGYSVGEGTSQPLSAASVAGPKSVAILGAPGVYDEGAWLSFLREYPLAVTRIDLISSPLSARTLSAFDLVIVDRLSRTFDVEEAAALESWVHGGGSLLSLTGYANGPEDVERPNSLLARLPVQYLPGLFLLPSLVYVSDFTAHPTSTGLSKVPFWGGYHVQIAGVCDGPTGIVASFERASVGMACQHGAGRVYVWGDEWVEYSSQWTPDTDASKFWKNTLDWLTHRT